MTHFDIRAYQAADRERVRHICHETGFMGEQAAWIWRDKESFADMFSGWYTDNEPQSAAVVTVDGVVSGYLLGCEDSTRVASGGATIGRHIVRRGITFRAGTAGIIRRSFTDGIGDALFRHSDPRRLEFQDPRWPAHLHIDLLPAARGQGLGRQLIRRFFGQLTDHGITGCHLGTFAENHSGLAFFESVGFRRHHEPMLAPGFRTRAGERMHSQTMVIELKPTTRP